MRLSKRSKVVLPLAVLLVIFLGSCSGAVYVHQNGTTYNDYEVATNYRIKSATPKKKINHSKAPNWRKYNQQNKYKRYN